MDLNNTSRVRIGKLAKRITGSKYVFADRCCCCQRAAQRELGLLDKEGKVWVSGWEKRYHQWIPIYSPGNKPDVPKPPRITGAERQRTLRAKSPELREEQNEAKRQARLVKPLAGKSDWETLVWQMTK